MNNCLTCYNNSTLSSSGTCICPSRTYFDIYSKSCQYCDPNCKECSGPSSNQCSFCFNNMTLTAQGDCSCQNGTYLYLNSKTCLICNNSCKTCTGPSSNQCSNCHDSLILTNGTCMNTTCTTGTYLDDSSSQCLSCHQSCLSCNGSGPGHCLSCKNNLTFSNGECRCNQGEYLDSTTQTCQTCDSSCEDCSGPANNQCTTCKNNMILSSSNRCGCTNGTYLNTSVNTCMNCSSQCQECSGPQPNQCSTCYQGFFLNSSSTCSPCDNTCLTCNGTSKAQCFSCNNNLILSNNQCICSQGQYLDSSSTACLNCDNTCNTCSGPASTQCTSCKNNMILYSNQCKCPIGTYLNTTSLSCMNCSDSCHECSGPQDDQCLSCDPPQFLDDNNYCVDQCSSNQYRAQDRSCQQCDSTCKTCSDSGPNNCASCPPGYNFQGQTCISNGCYFGCKTCSGASERQCNTCLEGFSFLQVSGYNGECLQQCPQSFFVTTVSPTISICNTKTPINNLLVYGSTTSQVRIMMLGSSNYDYNTVENGIRISIEYAPEQPPINYTYSFEPTTDNSYILLSFDFIGHLLPGSTLTLSFEEFYQDNITSYYLVNNIQSIELGEVYKYSAAVEAAVNATAELTMATSQANSFFSWIASFLSASIHSMRSRIVEDLMAYFIYVNIRFPPNLITYQNNSQNPLNFLLPNAMQAILEKVAEDSQEEFGGDLEDHQQNEDMGYALNTFADNRVFLVNFGGPITVAIILLLVITVLELVRRRIPPKEAFKQKSLKRRLREGLDSLSYSLRWNFMVNQFVAVFLDLTFFSLLQAANGFNLVSGADYFKYITAVFGLIISLLGVVFLLHMSRKLFLLIRKKASLPEDVHLNKEDNDILERFKILHHPFNSKKITQLLYPFALVLRSYLFVYVLILLPKAPLLQPLYSLLSTIIMIIFLVRLKPIPSRAQLVITIIYEGLYLTASFFAIVIHLYNKNRIADITVRSHLGFVMICCSLLMSIMDITSMLVEAVKFIRSIRKSKKITTSKSTIDKQTKLMDSPSEILVGGCFSPKEDVPLNQQDIEMQQKDFSSIDLIKSPYTDRLKLRFFKHDGTSLLNETNETNRAPITSKDDTMPKDNIEVDDRNSSVNSIIKLPDTKRTTFRFFRSEDMTSLKESIESYKKLNPDSEALASKDKVGSKLLVLKEVEMTDRAEHTPLLLLPSGPEPVKIIEERSSTEDVKSPGYQIQVIQAPKNEDEIKTFHGPEAGEAPSIAVSKPVDSPKLKNSLILNNPALSEHQQQRRRSLNLRHEIYTNLQQRRSSLLVAGELMHSNLINTALKISQRRSSERLTLTPFQLNRSIVESSKPAEVDQKTEISKDSDSSEDFNDDKLENEARRTENDGRRPSDLFVMDLNDSVLPSSTRSRRTSRRGLISNDNNVAKK